MLLAAGKSGTAFFDNCDLAVSYIIEAGQQGADGCLTAAEMLIASDDIPHFCGQILKCLRPRNQRRHNKGSDCLCRLIPVLFGGGVWRQKWLFGLILLRSHADDN